MDALFPDVPLGEWVKLWKLGYEDVYKPDDDADYTRHMAAVHAALAVEERRKALEGFFLWKDPVYTTHWRVVASFTDRDWHQFVSEDTVPRVWASGIVCNVFLWHVATKGARTLIDQHAWRGYCHLIRREPLCEFPNERSVAANLYNEYEA